MELLEDRRLAAGGIFHLAGGGAVSIDGTSGADLASASVIPGPNGNRLAIRLRSIATGQLYEEYPAANINLIYFHGYEGNDTFTNNTSVEVVAFGGAGNDELIGGVAADFLYGGSGNDTLKGGSGNDWLQGFAGNDQLEGQAGNDNLYGGTGQNTLSDVQGTNTLVARKDGPGDKWVAVSEEKVLSSSVHVWAREIVGWTNKAREQQGRPALRINLRLTSAARHHAANMARFRTMAHELPAADLPTLIDRVNYYGYRWRQIGENVAYNYRSTTGVTNGWMASPGHRANILHKGFKEIGVGVSVTADGQTYYCQVFGTRM